LKKKSKNLQAFISAYFLATSLFGLCVAAALTFNSPAFLLDLPHRKRVVGLLFASMCLLGILAGVFPSRCSRILDHKSSSLSPSRRLQVASEMKPIEFKGHHPDCGGFSAHVFNWGERTYCAGCTGLVLGATASFLGAILYFFAGLRLGQVSYFVFWAGFVGVACGLLQYHVFNFGGSLVHLSLNFIFVFGFLLLLVGADAIARNFAVDLYLLTLCVFWVFTRVMFSRQEHERICSRCNVKFCEFSNEA